MDVKYSRLATDDHDATTIDISPSLDFNNLSYPKYFSYTSAENMYNSIYTYSRNKLQAPNLEEDMVKPTVFQQGFATFITVLCYILMGATFPLSWIFCLKKVPNYERLVVYRLGRLLAVKQPGYTTVLPCIDSVSKVNMRTKAFKVPPQRIITGDGAILEIGADIFYRVKDPVLSVSSVQDLNYSLRITSVSSLQTHVSKLKLKHIDSEKSITASYVQNDLNDMGSTWGVEVGKVELSHVKIVEEENPVVAAATGGGVDPIALIGQLLGGGGGGSSSTMSGLPPFNMIPSSLSSPTASNSETNLGVETSSDLILTPESIIATVKPMLNYEMVRQYGVICQFNVVGQGGGVFYLDLKTDEGSAGHGEPTSTPDVTLTLSITDLHPLFSAQISAFDAYMGGRLQVDGDLRAAMNLRQLVEDIHHNLRI